MTTARKIAIFLPNLTGGGAERVAVHLANGLADRGCDVEIVLARAQGPYLDDVSPKVGVVDLRARRLLTAIAPLSRYLARRKPDILFSHLEYANVGAVIARSLARTGARLVLTVHATLSMSDRDDRSRRAGLVRAAIKRLYPKADAVVAVSRGCADDLIRSYGVPRDLVRVIYNPVIGPGLLDRAREPAPNPWLEDGGPPVILGIGRLISQKDFPTLIEAFALLRKQRKCRLLILGEGGDRRALESLISRRGLAADAALPGFVKNPYACLSRCSVFALSSVWEALPTVIIEALAVGARVVSTDCPTGPREILRDGAYGRLVPPGDPAALARAIGATMDQPPPGLPESALRPFTLEAAAGEYAKLIEELVARGSR